MPRWISDSTQGAARNPAAAALVLAVAVCVAILVSAPMARAVETEDKECRPEQRYEHSPAFLRSGMAEYSALLTKKAPQGFEIEFRRGRDPGNDSRILDLVSGPETLPPEIRPTDGGAVIVRHSNLLDSETRTALPEGQVYVYATLDTQSEQIKVAVCVDPQTPEHVAAGKYSGTVSLSDPRFQAVDIPVVVTLQSRAWGMALLVTVLGGSLGGGWGVLSSLLVKGADAGSRTRPSARLLVGLGFSVGLLAGIVTYIQGYDDKPEFRGADLGDWLTLGLTTFAYAAATYTITLTLALGWDRLRQPSPPAPTKEQERE